ncbi:glycosyltransferase family 39 protein [Kitasatospora sp. DSM 101779]|uniref:glycosyltransferase family 39 protein n=1 Tax=Kitasatospora sp. DSM 101779 TaxID=2853165 RepID=UPI0021D902BC|nr:glycosyltransferase family 39 protein [Kitasatospora sp. DSM 101779]MCU7824364.1 glycosyltransferase family 39 protein [Kitasatospora sp. DSM 101779]
MPTTDTVSASPPDGGESAASARGGAPVRLVGRLRRAAADVFWLWAPLLTLALGLRGSGRPELWRDELATWSAATRTTGQLFDMLQHVDAVSGTYYLLMHYWIAVVGDSATMLRLPSALAMAGSAVFVTLTARRLFDTRTAMIAGLLFAAVPSISRYAQEARAYAFVVLAVSAATWLLLRALERPTAGRWALYTAAVAVAGLFHMVSLVVLCPHALFAFWEWRRTRDRRLLVGFPLSALVALVPVVPLVFLGQRQVGRQISWLKTPWLQTFVDYWHNLFGSALVSGCILVLVAIPAGWPRLRRRAFEVFLLAGLPIVVTWVVSHGPSVYFFDRYQLYTVPAWCILAAAGLNSLRPKAIGAIGLAVVIAIGVPDQLKLRTSDAHETTDGRRAAALIAAGYRPGDAFAPTRGDDKWMMLDEEVRYYLPDSVDPGSVLINRTAVERADIFAEPCSEPAACLHDAPRIWVVTMGGAEDPLVRFPEAEAAALRASYRVFEVRHVRGLTVGLLVRSTG